ncbi:MAG: hypothetical protein OXG92_05205 [Chloroflexi bacterium]|nr:hypothetical protein [Chloroflexota bacterium]MCY3582807.1 hypothetical protein [Chloroflexota bacterium]MCY3715844.1 hypothetical protein [Chloroflexota bacterium]MDE2651929.1 hypothetical protein [Chloroflexota bacterium]MXV91886.1 hypothetical protein [Chloroflexota bacterium]
MASIRQQVLTLYLSTSALDSRVLGWSIYDGTGAQAHTTGDSDSPPYETGLDALRDGWRLLQLPVLIPPYPGEEYSTSFMKYGFVFEKLEDTGA